MTIFNKIKSFNHKGSFEGWMKRVVINTALHKYRRKNLLSIVTEEIPEEIVIEVDEELVSMDYLLEIIQQLPDRYRLVFNMYILDGYSHKEIAEELNITNSTSKSNLCRARVILKEKIEESFQKKSKTYSQ